MTKILNSGFKAKLANNKHRVLQVKMNPKVETRRLQVSNSAITVETRRLQVSNGAIIVVTVWW